MSFELKCDVRDHFVRTMLGQRKDKMLYSIYYASKTIANAQLNYITIEKALLIIFFAFDKFRPTKYLTSKKDAKPRLRIK